MSPPAAAREAHGRFRGWLFADALPIWWDRGADRAGGGFVDRLELDGRPAAGVRRVRVQARQAFVYALARRLGWEGPAAEAYAHAIAGVRPLVCEDGLYRIAPGAPAPLDGMGLLYDQAFVLLALAAAHATFGDPEAETEAERLARRLQAFAHPLGGYSEAPGLAEPLFANPNMHLFESFQAWSVASPARSWKALADIERDLALGRLIDPTTGALGERFSLGWSAPAQAEDRIVWPGHLYEWAFLLMSWDESEPARAAALRLIEIAETAGVDRESGVVYYALDEDLAPIDRGGRLWSQTERLRACAAAAALTGDAGLWDAALQSHGVLERFLETPTRGLWRDRIEPDGSFREEPAPASSLYHLASALEGLEAALLGPAVGA